MAIALAMALLVSSHSFSQVVTSGADDGSDGTLRQEIADTPSGGIITFEGVTTVTLNSELVIDKSLRITGPLNAGELFLTIDANFQGRSFNVTSGNVELDDLIITNGVEENGGAIYVSNAILLVNNSRITGNVANGTGSPAGSGGGIFVDEGAVLTVTDTEMSSNQANRAGGAIEDNSGAGLGVILNNVDFENNNAGAAPASALPGNGGAVHITGAGDITITGGSVIGNVAGKEGGGLWNGTGTMTITGVDIEDNMAIGNDTGGGGIFNLGGTVLIDAATTLTGNIAMGDTPGGRGGAIFNNTDGVLDLANGLNITGNYASRAGGAIEDASNGTLTLNGVIITGNAAGVDIGLGNTITPNPGNGGGIHLSGTTNADIRTCTVNDNHAALEGGGLWNNLGTMTVGNTIMDMNVAEGDDADTGGGAIFNNGGTLIVEDQSALTNNVASGTSGSGGGILSVDGSVTVQSASSGTATMINNNLSNRAGGGIEIIEGTLTLQDITLNGNNTGVSPATAAPGNGGGLHVSGNATITINGGTVNANVAALEGGGLWNGTGLMTIDGTMIDGNEANGNDADNGGAGVFNVGGNVTIQNNTLITNNVSNGTSASGGGLLSLDGQIIVTNSTFDSNSANRAGGAIEIVDGDMDFTDSVMSNNDVDGTAGTPNPGSGGAFHVTGTSGTINIMTSTITNNAAANQGGGLWNQDGTTMNVMQSTIDNNTASTGGGIYNKPEAVTNVTTSTITMNMASADGGGIFRAPAGSAGSLSVNASTIATNTAATGGGINGANEVTVKNSIIALNTANSGTDVSGTVSSNDYNLIGTDDLDVFAAQANDIEEADPVVGPLQDNGGTTLTHALLQGSPAFDAGDSVDTFIDQIGQSVFGASRDIGAFEAQATLSINGFDNTNITGVYPNPTTGSFNIEIGNAISRDINLKIIDINGRLVKERELTNGLNPVDISGMDTGIYILSFTSGNNKVTHKLILD